jgi:hypothetical protein
MPTSTAALTTGPAVTYQWPPGWPATMTTALGNGASDHDVDAEGDGGGDGSTGGGDRRRR